MEAGGGDSLGAKAGRGGAFLLIWHSAMNKQQRRH